MTSAELKVRTKHLALETIHLCDTLPNTCSANVIANQLLRSATSVGANYRAAGRARSHADFISKIAITLEETDESQYWLELIIESGMKSKEQVSEFVKEARELTAIFVASSNMARSKLNRNNKTILQSAI